MVTSATPLRFFSRSTMKRSTKSVISSGDIFGLRNTRYITACASASTLAMIGSWISSGSRPRTRLTRSRTSLAATSWSRSRRKRTVMRLDSARLVDSSTSMPSMPAIEPSSTCVTWLSTMAAEAPG
jgi:hypothetical protein